MNRQAPFVPHEADTYQDVAHKAQNAVAKLLTMLHAINAQATNSSDGGALISGAMGGVLQFALVGGVDFGAVRNQLVDVIDQVGPQIAMELKAHAAGAAGEGRA